MKILLFGSTGWIGLKMKQILIETKNFEVIDAKSRLDSFSDVRIEVQNTDFDYCFICAGITRDPKDPSTNIDWCEKHIDTTMNINYLGCLNLVDACNGRKIVYFGTGCIYEYNKSHPISGKGYTEYDEPNFLKSIYSYSKAMFEEDIKDKENILILRFRMPIDSYLSPRNIITKLIKYEKVINIPNSMSVLDDLLPLVPRMLSLEANGIYNFVNPGVISHNEILDLYKEFVDSNFSYTNFTLEEQEKVILAPRSNTALDCTKLLDLLGEIPEIHDSVREVMKRINNHSS
jgi:dTDP-4-dehydrorhamnose reductase